MKKRSKRVETAALFVVKGVQNANVDLNESELKFFDILDLIEVLLETENCLEPGLDILH